MTSRDPDVRLGGLSKTVGLPTGQSWAGLGAGPSEIVRQALERLDDDRGTIVGSTPVQLAASQLLAWCSHPGADLRSNSYKSGTISARSHLSSPCARCSTPDAGCML